MRDAGNHGAEDDRRDHHLDQLDEAVAERLDPVIGRKIGPQPADQGAEHDRDQHLNIEHLVPGLGGGHRRCGCDRCRHDVHSHHRIDCRSALASVPPHTAKINWASGVNGVAVGSSRDYPRRSSKRRIAGTSAAPSAFLISDAAMNGAIADQPGLLDAELHAEREPGKSGGKNDDVPEPHRHEQQRHRTIPAALAQPAGDEGRGHEAEQISGRRAQQRREAADRDRRTPAIPNAPSAR